MTKPIPLTCILLFLTLITFTAAIDASEPEKDFEPAVLRIRGYGMLRNRELYRSVNLLKTEETREYYDAVLIEDAAFLMLSVMKQDGYLEPSISVNIIHADGTESTNDWQSAAEVRLPRPTKAKEVHFTVNPGRLFFYDSVSFSGLSALDHAEAKYYFVPTDFLIPLKTPRRFTPQRLNSSISNLRDVLREKGYREATVVAQSVDIDSTTGRVNVEIAVDEGYIFVIRQVTKEIHFPDIDLPEKSVAAEYLGKTFSRRWVQDNTVKMRNRFLEQGYPDTTVRSDLYFEESGDGVSFVDISFQIRPGRQIQLHEIIFEGVEKTRETVIRRRIAAREGKLMNRLELQDARYRLGRLGIFDSVELQYEEVAPDKRNAIFKLKEGKEIEAGLMLGYGSYEMVRGGIEVAQFNIFGRAHRSRLQAVQSVKSSSIDYTYTVPEILRRNINAFVSASGLRRREIDFLRQEYGGSAGLQGYYRPFDSDLSLRYRARMLESSRFEAAENYGIERAFTGSVQFDINHDKRDNPIYPRSGYNINTSLETASQFLGGEANYQQVELQSSWHKEIGRGAYIHLGAKHGIIHPDGRPKNNLPFNRRFFPGGDNSVRGYQFGGAAPRDEDRKLIGAETYSLLNLEIEQLITPSWSIVLFVDGLAMAEDISRYPYSEALYSTGGGIRYKTFMGPLRVEYGHNPDPRDGDPSGTLHLSLGFPF